MRLVGWTCYVLTRGGKCRRSAVTFQVTGRPPGGVRERLANEGTDVCQLVQRRRKRSYDTISVSMSSMTPRAKQRIRSNP